MDLGLTDRPVIVCAASAGLGFATAQEFAREGARVLICGRRPAELERAAAAIGAATGRTPRIAVADLTQEADVTRLITTAAAELGGIYTLVHNAGGPPAGPFEQFDDAAWQAAFELNLLSCIRVTRAALPYLTAGGGGRIVNFASSSIRAPLENLVLSNTFRTAVLGLTKTLAGEFGPHGILANVLGPGRVQTDRIARLDAGRAARAGVSAEQIRADTARAIPLGRYGTPEEFARTAVFLGSPANTYVTGQALLVDGGLVKSY